MKQRRTFQYLAVCTGIKSNNYFKVKICTKCNAGIYAIHYYTSQTPLGGALYIIQ